MEFAEVIAKRYSCKRFDETREIAPEALERILEAGRLAPTAKNLQEQHVYVLQGPESLAIVDELTPCRYGAPTVIIGAYDAGVSAKGLGYETGDFGDIDTSIVLTNIANAAAAENLGSCWVGAYDSAIIRKNFNIPNNYVLVDLMMVGHSAEDAEPSPRHEQTEPLDTLVVRETF